MSTAPYTLSTSVWNSLKHIPPPHWVASGNFTDDPQRDAAKFAQKRADAEGYSVVPGSPRWVPFIDRTGDKEPTDWITFEIAFEAIPLYKADMPGCPGCQPPEPAFRPSHYPSRHCRSGKRTHCTCDGCF